MLCGKPTSKGAKPVSLNAPRRDLDLEAGPWVQKFFVRVDTTQYHSSQMKQWSIWYVLLIVGFAVDLGGGARHPAQQATPPSQSQPVPFSHNLHREVGLVCAYCHFETTAESEVVIPAVDTCMACHVSVKLESPSIQKLASYHRDQLPVPWVKSHALPKYVWFSHQGHHQNAALTCAACHTQAAGDHAVVDKPPTSMEFCMDCHAEQNAPIGCSACHLPLL